MSSSNDKINTKVTTDRVLMKYNKLLHFLTDIS